MIEVFLLPVELSTANLSPTFPPPILKVKVESASPSVAFTNPTNEPTDEYSDALKVVGSDVTIGSCSFTFTTCTVSVKVPVGKFKDELLLVQVK